MLMHSFKIPYVANTIHDLDVFIIYNIITNKVLSNSCIGDTSIKNIK